jgi:hypothetical protein
MVKLHLIGSKETIEVKELLTFLEAKVKTLKEPQVERAYFSHTKIGM